VKDVISVKRPKSTSSQLKKSVLFNTKRRCISESVKNVESHVQTHNKKQATQTLNVSKDMTNVIQLCLWIIDSGRSKHMTGNLKLLRNFIEKFMGIVRFGNDHFATITRYGDYVHRNVIICHVLRSIDMETTFTETS
ncbi:hypothetical protein Tco_1460782, partial [Tanacetum coccineum]